jgi:hypothetical protein
VHASCIAICFRPCSKPCRPQVPGRPSSGLAAPSQQAVHAYRAPLLARVHLRLGLWSWTAEVRRDQRI